MSDLYGFAQPATVNQFRDRTANHAKMAGVQYATFVCCKCGMSKRIAGSKMVTPKHPKDGRMCAECAPAVSKGSPVAAKKAGNGGVPVSRDKPASARKMTDEQVLECRADYEFNGATRRELEEKYGVTPSYMAQLLDYAVRSKLIPARHRQTTRK